MLGNILESERKTNIKMKKINDKLNEKINKNNAKPKLIEYNKKTNYTGISPDLTVNRQSVKPRKLVEFQKTAPTQFTDNYLNLSHVITPKFEDIISEHYSDQHLHAFIKPEEPPKPIIKPKPIINKSILNNNIQVIHQVFQSKFANNATPTGIGDFIRGCYYLIQFCNERNLKYEIDIYDHPIRNFLEYFKNKRLDEDLYVNTKKLSKQNLSFSTDFKGFISINPRNETDGLVDFLNGSTLYNGHIFVNIYYSPKMPIKRDHIQFMRSILKPTYEIEQEVHKKLTNLSLTKYNYIVLHVRMGDTYINENKNANNIDYKLIDKVIDNMAVLSKDNYLLITDSNILKKRIADHYPSLNIKFFMSKIAHTTHYENAEEIKNTMIDFYLMSYSKKIIGASTMSHGSGFSLWCAVTFDIPYSCKLIS